MLGVAYKADIDDMRESPATKIAQMIIDDGAHLSYHDPYVPEFKGMRSIELTPESLASFDVAVIITGHTSVDYDMVVAHAPLILDTRNTLAKFGSNKVVTL
jgi:UDP-N-acetyl-D-glucosamine dehydrogenase